MKRRDVLALCGGVALLSGCSGNPKKEAEVSPKQAAGAFLL